MFYLEMLLITLIVVFIVDVSGFIQHVHPLVNLVLQRHPDAGPMRPFACSLCMTFWAGLAYVFFTGFSLTHLAFVCLCAFGARFAAELIFLIRDLLDKLIEFLTKQTERI